MARQSYRVNSQEKQMEVFNNFIGGLNTVAAQSNLSDSELTDIKNMSLDSRGSLKRRTGVRSTSKRNPTLWSDIQDMKWNNIR